MKKVRFQSLVLYLPAFAGSHRQSKHFTSSVLDCSWSAFILSNVADLAGPTKREPDSKAP